MQRGRFAQEFLAELLREPRALRMALLGERARWLRGLKVGGREELLFELELLLRGLELSFDRRHQSPEGRPLLGFDFSDELRAVRDALHRASLVARRLTSTAIEQGIQFRAYVERQAAEEQRRGRLTHELVEQRSPDESLILLRQSLRALQGLADQLLKTPFITFQAFSDFATLGEQVLLSSKYFRPPTVLEFRTEYDRVGSVRLLELVKRVSESRARKSLALAFLACFRLLRYLRYIPAAPTAVPRRALLTILLVRDEAMAVASYLETDVPRLTAAAAEAQLVSAAAGEAAELLRNALASVSASLAERVIARDVLEKARELFGEAAKGAASALAHAVEPGSNAADIFDGQRARRERAERLRQNLWVLGQLLRSCLDDLFPAVKGEPTRAIDAVVALIRFVGDFRQMGYYLLRAGDHEPFDRFFGSLEALTNAAPSPARDRHLYLECRRFVTIIERGLALVSRRAELLDIAPDLASFQAEYDRYRAAGTSGAPALDAVIERHLSSPEGEDSRVRAAPNTEERTDPFARSSNQPQGGAEPSARALQPLEPAGHVSDAEQALAQEPYFEPNPDFEEADLDLSPAEFESRGELLTSTPLEESNVDFSEEEVTPPAVDEPFNPELTRRIWRGD